MSRSGNWFDGVVSTPTVTASTNEANQFIANSSTNQYITTASSMTLWVRGSTNSTFSFNDSSQTPNSSLLAKNGLFTGQVTSQYQTISPQSSQTVPGVSITGPVLNSDNLLPLLKVQKTQGGVTSEFTNVSPSYPVLKLFNTSSTPTYVQYSQAENLQSGSSISHLFGKNTSSNANAFLLQYYYDTLEANRKFTIRAWGDTISALEIYKSGVTGTSATTGSVVVNGDLGSTEIRTNGMTLYGTSGSARIIPATTTTSYQLTLPSSIGAVNDYLKLSAVSGTNGTLAWAAGTAGGSGAAYVAAAAYSNSSYNFNTSGNVYNMTFPTTDYNVNTGITYGTGGQSDLFQNVSGGTLYVQVNGYINFNSNATGYRYLQIVTYNGTTTSYFNTSRVAANASGTTEVITSGIVSVANNQWFGLKASQNSGGSLGSSVKIQFSVLGGAGLQSVTLSALSTNQASTLFTTTTQQTGQNPTVSFDLAQTPTGSGKFVLATSPTISGLTTTGTLTSSTVSATSLVTPILKETPLVVDMADTVLYPTASIQLTSSYTNIILKGTRAGFTVYLPIASSLDIGQVIKIKNTSPSTSSSVTIYAYGTFASLDLLLQNQQTFYTLIDNTGLLSSAGDWKVDCLLDKAIAETRYTGLNLKPTKDIIFNTTTGSKVSLIIDDTSTTYNCILPTTPGAPGQVLTSQGGTSAMTWSDTLTNQAAIDNPLSGHRFGSSTTSIESSSIIRLQAISSNTTQAILRLDNYSTNSCVNLKSLATYLQPTQFVGHRLGKQESSNNSISQRFYYEGDESTLNNYVIQFYNQSASTQLYPPNISATSTEGTLKVNGGVTCTSLYSPSITCPNFVTTTIDSTTINTTTLNVNTVNLPGGTVLPSFSSGTKTPTFWWGYDTLVVNCAFSYPTMTPNVKTYQYQQIGKSYSFSLSIAMSLTGSLTLYNPLFINDCNPPIPAQGQIDQVGSLDTAAYSSAVLMLPAK